MLKNYILEHQKLIRQFLLQLYTGPLSFLMKREFLDKLEFGDGRARYEDAERDHHDHLIDINSGSVIEFVDSDIEKLQEKIANKLGYKLMGHKLELYGVPLKSHSLTMKSF